MADTKITALTADASPTSDDLVPTVNDPGGTPANRKVTAGNLITKAHGLTDGAVVSVSSGTLVSNAVTASAAELNHVDGVTSAIQTQLDGKVSDTGDTMTGSLTIDSSGTANLDIDRGATSNFAGTNYKTAGVNQWFMGLRSSGGTNSLHVRDAVNGVSIIDAALGATPAVTAAGAWTFGADVSVPDEAYDATNWNGSLEVPTKNAVRDKIESLGGSPITLKTSAVLGSAAAEIGVSSLDLNTDKVYKIYAYIVSASGGSSIIGVKVNGVTSATNYHIQRISGDGATAGAARENGATRSLGVDTPASQAQVFEINIAKVSGGTTRMTFMPMLLNATSSMVERATVVHYNDTTNVTSFALTDESGSSFMDTGTAMRVFTLGF